MNQILEALMICDYQFLAKSEAPTLRGINQNGRPRRNARVIQFGCVATRQTIPKSKRTVAQ